MARANYFYFRNVTSLGDDDSTSGDSIMVPVSDITGFHSPLTEQIDIYFKNQSSSSSTLPIISQDSVALYIEGGKSKALMKLLAEASNGPVHHDGITIVCDDTVVPPKNLSTDIKSIVNIYSYGSLQTPS
tara:strand:+ start:1415 stop:1804 length:390 start_codon:yes stop_codon:yes gene_type:complete